MMNLKKFRYSIMPFLYFERNDMIKKFRPHLWGNISFYYQHINNDNDIRIGKCDSKPELLENGLLRMYESWQWLNGDKSAGNSILEEIKER